MLRLIFALVVCFGGFVGHAYAREAPSRPIDRAQPAQPDVVMYVMPGCGYCDAARAHLRERGVAWKERDITTSAQASEEFDAYGARGTPLILVGERRVTGFDPEAIDALLGPLSAR